MTQKLVECVPNFSEGRDERVIAQITGAIEQAPGVTLLDVDPGRSTNRTVVTFVGEPDAVVEAAFAAIRAASEVIDMRRHHGEHPRMGATDVCPLVPIAGITMAETVELARRLAERVGRELAIPVYLYEEAATRPERRNLANIRAGEYEGLPDKLQDPAWSPDYGPAAFNARSGATVIGARTILVAYNVNLNTTSTRRANAVAFDVRERGRVLREGGRLTGEVVRDDDGQPVRIPGALEGVKAIGWYIEEYGICQVSMNLTDVEATPLHVAFEAVREQARARGLRVTGSELVGMVPLRLLREAGAYFLRQQHRSLGLPEAEIVRIAVRSLGLDDLAPFDPERRVIEYALARKTAQPRLVDKPLTAFADAVAAETPTPGGGSVAAAVGALGAALGVMVANLSAHKRGWDARWETFSDWAVRGRAIQDALVALVDEDTRAFDALMDAIRRPKASPEQRAARSQAVEAATRRAIEVPLRVMRTAYAALELLEAMVKTGNPNSVTDAAVGALCVQTAVMGAYLNVRVNAQSLPDPAVVAAALDEGASLQAQTQSRVAAILHTLDQNLAPPPST